MNFVEAINAFNQGLGVPWEQGPIRPIELPLGGAGALRDFSVSDHEGIAGSVIRAALGGRGRSGSADQCRYRGVLLRREGR